MGRLRELRKLSGLTINEAARVAGVSSATLSIAERSFAKLTAQQVEKLESFYFEKISGRLTRLGKLIRL